MNAGAEVGPHDLSGLRGFLDSAPNARGGIVFYSGELVLPMAERIRAIPISALWTAQPS